MTRVLVVDGDPSTREILCETLAWEGFATLTARDGQEALEILWKSAEPLVAPLDYIDSSRLRCSCHIRRSEPRS